MISKNIESFSLHSSFVSFSTFDPNDISHDYGLYEAVSRTLQNILSHAKKCELE